MMKLRLNAGHGYSTPGKRSPDGMKEYEFNRAVVLEMKRIFDAEYTGVEISFAHSDARDVPLGERTDKANADKVDCYTSIHANAFGSGGFNSANGIETFVHPSKPKEALRLATLIQNSLINQTGLTNRGVKTANFHELRETAMTAVLVECGFMTNKNDLAKLKSDAYRKQVARIIVEAHAVVFGLKKKPVAKPTPAPSETTYRVVTGSFQDKENAEQRVSALKKAGFESFILAEKL
jgi:N-acetylmuramoyl-L-alanine amidase